MSLRISGQFRFHILVRGETIMRLSRHIRETIDQVFRARRDSTRHAIVDALRNAQLGGARSLALFCRGHLCCQRWYLCLSRGGFDGSANQVHNDLLRFDLAINSWTSLASSPDSTFSLRR
jgi:hypothetical protein